MAEFNLKSPHVSCLYYIYKLRSLTATELCDISMEDKAAVSRSIDYLEKNGYLSCKASSTQKRYRAPLVLTEKGEITAKRIANKLDAILEKAGEGVSDEHRQILYRSLSVICQNLDTISENKTKNNTNGD